MPTAAPTTGPEMTPLRRLVRLGCAVIFVIGPCLGVAALAAVWVRSSFVDELTAVGHDGVIQDAVAGTIGLHGWQIRAETLGGVLGLTLIRDRWTAPTSASAAIERVEQRRADYGWHHGRVRPAALTGSTTSLDPLEQVMDVLPLPGMNGLKLGGSRVRVDRDEPYQPFGRERSDIGPLRTFHWKAVSWSYPLATLGGQEAWKIHRLVAPIWVWMLPLAGPLLWWAWCPPGRVVPRLTIRRTLIATGLAALLMALMTIFLRGAAADQALEVVAEFDGDWRYSANPAGSGPPVVTWINVGPLMGGPHEITDADIPRLHRALTRLPHLKKLLIFGSLATGPALGELVAGLTDLEEISFNGTNADDTSLRPLRDLHRLKALSLNGAKVTDAGLAHLAGLPALETLELVDLPLTDAGLLHLAGLPKLRTIYLQFTSPQAHGVEAKVSDAAMKRLADSLPAFESLVAPDGRTLDRRGFPPRPPEVLPWGLVGVTQWLLFLRDVIERGGWDQ